MKPVCVFYYGGWSTSIKNRFIAAKPKWVVSDIGVWRSIPDTDIAELLSKGIMLCAYIPAGGMRGFIWNADDTTDKTPSGIKALIDQAVAKGFKGVFFDEGGIYTPNPPYNSDAYCDRYLASPGSAAGGNYNGHPIRAVSTGEHWNASVAESWKGLTIEYYTSYAKSKGLFVVLNFSIDYESDRVSRMSANVFPLVDRILVSEQYVSRDGGQSPRGIEVINESKCWVLDYSGSFNAQATINAINYGFDAAYCCESMGSLSSNFETYMSQIPDSFEPIPEVVSRTVTISGTVDAGDKPVTGLSLTIKITKPDGTVDSLTATVDPNKVFIQAANYSALGTYSAELIFAGNNDINPFSDTQEFVIPEIVPLPPVKADLTANWTIVVS